MVFDPQLLAAIMDITFSWERRGDSYVPVSRSSLLNQDGVSLLDCLLMDDGGVSSLETLPWLDEGIQRAAAVAAGELESTDWSRETWGVALRNPEAKIYSLYDEEYVQVMGLGDFLEVLHAWRAFLRSRPDAETTEEKSASPEIQ